jgi:hypothetical protein
MTLAELPSKKFNDCLREIFGKTKRGERILKNIVSKIETEKDKDDFNDFIRQGNDGHQIEDGYYTSEELISDSISQPIGLEEKKHKTRKNDKGEIVPEKCDKCGSKVGLYIKGEPVYLCSNKDCGKYFGTMPFNG